MALTLEEKQQAEAIVNKWYWQVEDSRSYFYKNASKTLMRFYESAPLESNIFRIVLEYLRTQENITEIWLNNQNVKLDGTYKAVMATYRTNPNEAWQGTTSKKVRITQMLQSADSSDEDGPYTIEDGCWYKTSHTFAWDVADIPTCPESSSGVMYTIHGLTRDKETGLYSYVIERKERVEVTVPLYATQKTIFSTNSEEQHLGVKQDNVASTGELASVMPGKIITRNVSKNQDCTSNIENKVITENNIKEAVVSIEKSLQGTTVNTTHRGEASPLPTTGLEIGESRTSKLTDTGLYDNTIQKMSPESVGKIDETCGKTIFNHEHSTTSQYQTDPGGVCTDDAGGGTTYQTSVSRTSTGGWQRKIVKTIAKSVSNVVKAVSRTLRANTTSVTHKNQSSPLSGNPKVGETYRSQRNADGTYDNTIETLNPVSVGQISESCSKDVFKHTHEKTTNQSENPGTAEVAVAGNGVVRSRTVLRRDDGGYDVQERTTTESSVSNVRKTIRTTLRKIITATTSIGANNALQTPDVGCTNSYQKTEGGLYQTTTETAQTRSGETIAKSKMDSKGVMRKSETQPSNSCSVSVSGPINKVEEQTSRQNEDGSYDVTTTTTEYKEQDSGTHKWSDADNEYEELTYSNKTNVPSATNTEAAVSASFQLNDHGSYDGRIMVTKPKTAMQGTRITKTIRGVRTTKTETVKNGNVNIPDSAGLTNDASRRQGGVFQKTTETFSPTYPVLATSKEASEGRTVTTETRAEKTSKNTATSAKNKIETQASRLNEDGSYDVTTTTTEYKEQDSGTYKWSDADNEYEEVTYSNKTNVPSATNTEAAVSASFQLNDHGSYDGRIMVTKPKTAMQGTRITKTIRGVRTTKTETVKNGNVEVPTSAGLTNDASRRSGGVFQKTTETFSPTYPVLATSKEASEGRTVTTETRAEKTSKNTATSAKNKIETQASRLNEDGSYDVTTTKIAYKKLRERKTWHDAKHNYERIVYRYADSPEILSGGVSCTNEFHFNEAGSFDGSATKVTERNNDDGGNGICSWSSSHSVMTTLDDKIYTGTKKVIVGDSQYIANKVSRIQEYPEVGWMSSVTINANCTRAMCVVYDNVKITNADN